MQFTDSSWQSEVFHHLPASEQIVWWQQLYHCAKWTYTLSVWKVTATLWDAKQVTEYTQQEVGGDVLAVFNYEFESSKINWDISQMTWVL